MATRMEATAQAKQLLISKKLFGKDELVKDDAKNLKEKTQEKINFDFKKIFQNVLMQNL